MTDLVTALQTAISVDTLLSNLTLFIPFVGAMVVFAFIYRIIRRTTQGASKGKAKV